MTTTPSRAPDRLRLVFIGAGWIAGVHLTALDRLDRTKLVGVASRSVEHAAAIAAPRGAAEYGDVDRMLDEQRPDVAFVAVPPGESVALCELLVERGIPFLVEKPLAARDADGPGLVEAAISRRGLVVAVGYHLRALEALGEARERLAANPAELVVARWLDSTPTRPWWWKEDSGGGQVVEQATHLFDLARVLVGEATVVGAVSVRRDPIDPPGADVADATAALLRFDSGAIGTFANTRRAGSPWAEITMASVGLATTIGRPESGPGDWTITFSDETGTRRLPSGRDPYERQAERFLDAVVAGRPDAVYCTYRDALATYRLTRAVVGTTGDRG